jgi:hypothetical protein
MTVGMLASFSFVDFIRNAAEEGVGPAARGDRGSPAQAALRLGIRDHRPRLKTRGNLVHKATYLLACLGRLNERRRR